MNLDGGGSATMVVKGKIVNKPSDASGERPVTTCVLVLPHARTTAVLPRPPDMSADATAALAESQDDPGSAGGLTSALGRGAFG